MSRTSQIFIKEFFQIYKEYVLGQLLSASPEKRNEICQAGKFNPYIFWRICSSKQRTQIPKDILNQISDSAAVLLRQHEAVDIADDLAYALELVFQKG